MSSDSLSCLTRVYQLLYSRPRMLTMVTLAGVAREMIGRARTGDGAEIATEAGPGTEDGAVVDLEIGGGGAGLVTGGDLAAETDTGGAGPGTDTGAAGPETGGGPAAGTGRGGAGHPGDVAAQSLPSEVAGPTTSSTSGT